MFPEELERMIWRMYFSSNVLYEIKNRDSIWENPSEDLFKNTIDYGAIQKDHTDLERIFKQFPPHFFPLDFVVEGEYNDKSCEYCNDWYYNRCPGYKRDNWISFQAKSWWDLSFYPEEDYLI